MEKRIVFISILVLVFIALLMFLVINAWYPMPRVKEVCNTSITGNLRIMKYLDGEQALIISYTFNGRLLSNVYLIAPPCNITSLLSNYSGIITSVTMFESFYKRMLAIASYNISNGGTVGDIVVYDVNGKSIAWRLGDIKLRNVTLTRIMDPGFAFAGIDSSGDIIIAKVVMQEHGFGYEWTRTFNAIMYPQKNDILIVYGDPLNTLVVGAGKSLVVLDYYNGGILLGVRDIGGVIEKISWLWDKYVVLVNDMGVKKILILYKDKYGLWNYTTIYSSSKIIDIHPVMAARLFIAVAEGLSPSEAYSRNNTSSILLLIDSEGNIKYKMNTGNAIMGIRGCLYPESKSGPYILVDCMYVNGSKTTYYSGLISPSKNRIAWKYSSLRPLRSFIVASGIYVVEYEGNKSILHYNAVTMISS